jgi:hypothetical protein
MVNPVFLQLDGSRVGARIIETKDLQESAIPWTLFIRGDDAVAGLLFSANTA